MALKAKSIFNYGLTVTVSNNNIPFYNGTSNFNAVVPVGDYTLGMLATAIALQMSTVDTANSYTCTVDRTQSGGTQNRITIASSGGTFSLLWSSGTLASTSITSLINFGASDLTGATTYTNSTTTGTALQPSWWGFNYQGPLTYQKNIGVVNVSASGVKEQVSWSIQQFIKVEFKYESQAAVLANWEPMWQWLIQQKPIEFIPEITSPSTVYSCTLEKSAADGKGLGFEMKEQLPDFPFLYDTGPLEFRLVAGTY